jgi:uncharacterized repeat protein (TIGR01451 family)
MNTSNQRTPPIDSKRRKALLRKKRALFAAFLGLTLAAMAITAISISSAQSKNPAGPAAGASLSKSSRLPQILARDFGASRSEVFAQDPAQKPTQVPVLTLQNAPDVPQCRLVGVRQEILDEVNAATEDPAVTFEKNRRLHPHMIEMPPTVECASGLWRAARRGGAEEPAVDPDVINQRQFSLDSVFLPSPLAAAVGTNIDPSNGVEGYQGENSISINPNNPNQIIAHSNTFFRDTSPQCQSPTGGTGSTFGTMALFGSSDGGATWTYKCAPWHTSVTGGIPGASAWFGSDPALAWDNSGRAYACYMLLSEDASGNAGAAIVVARSTDSGATWSQFGNPVVNRITSTTNLDDKEMFVIDNTSGQAHSFPGRMYVIWDEGNAERIAHSDDGVTWSTVTPASNTGAIGGNLAIAPDGTVYAIWTRFNVETIVFSKSTDGGTTWTAPAVIATNALQSFGSNNLPPAQNTRGINGFGSIDVDRNPNSAFFGNIYVAFSDFPSGTSTGADINAYLIRSTNGGTTWSARLKVNDDNFGATQFFPWLAVDQSDGSVNMSWIDSRLDPINRKTQSVYARSIDGGVSFEPNILVTDNGANWRNNVNYADENTVDNPSFNGNQYGDYSGIAAFNRQVHPLWTDSRMFFPTADTQSPTRREDNATSTIINCSAPSSISAPAVNSSTTPSVAVSWSAPTGWGTNATNGTYSVYRNTTATFPGGSPLASGLIATNYVDTSGVLNTTYFYFVRAKNNCPGTALTPMTTDSAASASVVYGSSGTPTGVLEGTVTSGGSAVSGIVVSAGTYSASTNGSGFYQFPAINAGTYTVSASPAGYSPASVSGVVVNGGATTVQDLSLTANSGSSCLTDTTFGDFSKGSGSTIDIAISPGDIKLAHGGGEALDQSSADSSTSGNAMTNTTWWGQTFTPATSGTLTKLDVELFCSVCSGTTSSQVVNIQATSGGLPTGAVLATATIPAFSSGFGTYYTVTFGSPATLTAGTLYAFTVHASTSISAGTYAVVRTTTNLYASGQSVLSSNSGASWATPTGSPKDLEFHTYITTPFTYPNPGNFTSTVKDSGAVTGATPNWTTLSWTNTLPANTTVKFQAAGSNSSSGPFNFVGPDGTAATFFTTSGASLSQFNGLRYLEWKAFLSTTNTANTPTLSDVTVCYNNTSSVSTTLTPSAATGTYGGTVNLSATLTDGTNPLSGKSISFTLNGNSVGSANTNGSGVASLSNVSLSGINAGSYPSGVGASFAGGGGYNSSSGTAALTVNKADQTITVNTHAPSTAVYNSQFTVAATGGGSGNAVTFSSAGACSNSGATFTMTSGTGTCTVNYDQAGNSNYNAATQVTESVTAQKATTTTTVSVSNGTYDGNPHGGTALVTGTAGFNQSLTVTYTGRNTTVYGPSTTAPTNAGDYTASASYAGDSNYNSSSDSKDYSIGKADQTITFNALADKTYGDADFGISASASSGLTVSFAASGNCTVTGSTVHITGAGSCTITASQGGDSNYNAASSVDRSFNIAKANQTITFGALSDKTYGDADFSVSATASSGLAVTFAAGGNCTVSGSTVHITGAGSCTITASQGGDSNYNAAADVEQPFNIAKANQTIIFDPLNDKTYGDGDFSVSATASSGLPVSFAAGGNCTVTGATVHITGAGSCTITASQTGDANYNAASSVDRSFNIAKANTTTTVTVSSATYDGNPHGGTAVVTGPAGLNQSLTVTYSGRNTTVYGPSTTAPTNAGDYTASASYAGDSNYNPSNDSKDYSIGKATPVITWSNPADIIYGTALSGTQLNATAGVPGGFVYTPAAGTVLGYGSHNLHVDFTPTDTANYNNAQKDVSINVLSALLTTTMTLERQAKVGYNHNYYIDITNNGNAAATSMTLSDPLPSQVRFTAVTTSQGSCAYNSGTHTLNCTLGTLGVGNNIHIQLTTKALQTGSLTNTATVNASQWDPATGGNTASITHSCIAEVDLSVSKVDSADPIYVSQQTTYTIVVQNYNTPISATGVVMTDNLPASFQFISATTSQGSLITPPVGSTGIVTANVGTLAVNGTATITITVRATTSGTISNTASVTANENESNPANNSAAQTTTVLDAALQKLLLAKQVLIGGCENTTGNVYLTGPAPAGGLTVNLSTTSLAGVTVPASVFIPAGSSLSPAFNVTTTPVATKQVGTVNGTLGVSTVSRNLTINVGSGTCPP